MIVNAQGQLQPLTPEQLATVRSQQAMIQQQQQQIIQPAGTGQEVTQQSIQIAGQTFSQSSLGNSITTDVLDNQSSNAVPIQQANTVQPTTSSVQLQQQQQIQFLQTSQASPVASQIGSIQHNSLPQQQIIQTVNGQQVLIQTPQVRVYAYVWFNSLVTDITSNISFKLSDKAAKVG